MYANGKLDTFNGRSVRTDNRGNILGIGESILTYDLSNRLKSVNAVRLMYNALGQRIKKISSGVNSYTIFDEQGRLLFRGDLSSKNTNTVYLNGKVIAEIDQVIEAPTISLTLNLRKVSTISTSCPKGLNCNGLSYFYKIDYGWDTTDANSCVVKLTESVNNVTKSTSTYSNVYQPTITMNLPPADTLYLLEATCSGSKGTVSASKSVAGSGYSNLEEM